MTDDNIGTEDVRAMRAQGDFRAYLRSVSQPTASAEEIPAAAAPKSRPDGRPVGAWPDGCGRPGSPVPHQPPA